MRQKNRKTLFSPSEVTRQNRGSPSSRRLRCSLMTQPLTSFTSSAPRSISCRLHKGDPLNLSNLRFQAPLTKTNFKAQAGSVCFKEATIRNIFQMILKFLDKTLLDYLDNLADDIFVSQTIRVFPYKSFSETLSLVLISLLRELLHQQADLAPCFIRDIQDYIKQVLTISSSSSSLSSSISRSSPLAASNSAPGTTTPAKEKWEGKGNNCRSLFRGCAHEQTHRATINKFKLNVQTNAACVDILVWAAREETGEVKLL